jgi:hypothetical protein
MSSTEDRLQAPRYRGQATGSKLKRQNTGYKVGSQATEYKVKEAGYTI